MDPNKVSMTRDVYKRTVYTLEEATQTVRDMNTGPRVIYLMVGTNDTSKEPEAVIREWDSLINLCQTKFPQTQIVAGGIPPMKHRATHQKIQQINNQLHQLCQQKRVGHVINENVLAQEHPFKNDGIHLSWAGFYRLAGNMYFGIKDAIAEPNL